MRISCCLMAWAAGGLSFLHASPRGFPLVSLFSAADIGQNARGYCVIQAPTGEIIVGTNALSVFDGVRWTHTTVPRSYGLRSLDFGTDGRLWMAANEEIGWFARDDSHTWRFHSLVKHVTAAGGAVGEAWYAFADAGGATFVTANQILRWDGSRFTVHSLPETRRLRAARVNGTIYVHCGPKGLYAVRPEGLELILPVDQLGEAAVEWMDARNDGLMLVTSKGLRMLRDGKLSAFGPEVSELLIRAKPISGLRLPDGRYAICTYSGGIILITAEGKLDRVFTDGEGLPTPYVNSLCLDHEGGLWGTSRSHIIRIDLRNRSTLFDNRADLERVAYHSLAVSGEAVLAASEGGLRQLTPGSRSFVRSTFVTEPVNEIVTVGPELLVGMMRKAAFLTADGLEKLHGTTSDVFAFGPSRTPGQILMADGRAIVAADVASRSSRIMVQGLKDIACSIAEDDAGHLWMGSFARGILHAQPSTSGSMTASQEVPAHFGLPATRGYTIARATAEGAVLVLAANGAWWKPAGGARFEPVANYPAREPAAAAFFDHDGRCWIVQAAELDTPAAVGRVSLQGGQARWEPHAVDGLGEIGHPRSAAVERQSDGTDVLWVGGTRSILRHEVGARLDAPKPAVPQLHAYAKVAEREIEVKSGEHLPAGVALIGFEFSSHQYSNRESLRLETRFEGIDAQWIRVGPSARRDLVAPRDGKYRLHVRALAETGAESDSASFEFAVKPPWWRTPPAVGAAVLAVIPIGYGFYLLRVRQLRRHNAELEKKVRQRTEELEAANKAKTAFVANMSHDLRNPLNGIYGLALALEDTRLDPKQREIVATLRECTTYLSSLVDDVLDFASIEAGKIELRPSPFAPQQLLRSILETHKADAAESGAQLAIETQPDVPAHLLGDAGRIQEILVNFVSNALKYAGGRILLSARAPEEAPGEIEFSVQDEGPGISAADQAVLFTKFTRLKQKHGDEDIPGTGLGLAACRLLADAMNGLVGVESAPGRGARFFLRLPLASAPETAPAPVADLPNTSVLLVEDTDYNAMAASAVLARLGLTCERARTGEEALRLFREKRFNVVLLDRNLPDMDGTEVARCMRELETEGSHAVLLAVTAYCTAEDRELCLQAGMDAFVGKPLTPEKLRRVLLDTSRRLIAVPTLQAAAPEAPDAAFDLKILSYLSDGTREGMEEQIRRFFTMMDETYAQMTAFAGAQDFAQLAEAAHKLLGYARMVGCNPLIEVITRLEVAARSREEAAGREGLEKVAVEIAALRAAVLRRPSAAPST